MFSVIVRRKYWLICAYCACYKVCYSTLTRQGKRTRSEGHREDLGKRSVGKLV
ncbi:hypothetical protein RRG08_066878 [Elysia crispata]|uniref:Uncharacterized protein n=1 Tax=Elysia crispata TaxID=231223 RepID=A0AAE1CXC4_9GAST|nr:hypothetical protein RRG08_066878 [Elysia crispata]